MERDLFIRIAPGIIAGIVIGLFIGFLLWHVPTVSTCPVPAR
jgi:F0F1-type ATP synthase assembly protein I